MGPAVCSAERVELHPRPSGPTGHPWADLSRADNTPAVLSEVNAGVCCACVSARFPVHQCNFLRCEGDGFSVPLPDTLGCLSSQRLGKLNLLYIEKINYFRKVTNGRSKGAGVIHRTVHEPLRILSATSRQLNKSKLVHRGPLPRGPAHAPARLPTPPGMSRLSTSLL